MCMYAHVHIYYSLHVGLHVYLLYYHSYIRVPGSLLCGVCKVVNELFLLR